MIGFGREITGEIEAVVKREWLVTNGIGGYAMGTPAWVRSRRYHGVLVAALKPPAQRTLLVAALDTWVEIDGIKYPLCTHEWAAGVLLPDGYRHLEGFHLDGTIPTWVWAINDLRIVQRLWMERGKNTTYITWDYERGSRTVDLQIIPLCTYRDHHGNTTGGSAMQTVALEAGAYRGVVVNPPDAAHDPHHLRILSDADSTMLTNEWWWSFHLARETERGLNANDDLFAAATFHRALAPGASMTMLFTAEPDLPAFAPNESLAAARAWDHDLLADADLDDAPDWIQHLALAADQFIVDRRINAEVGKSVIAGYPWFSDWSRDTMIALPGLTLAVNRPDIAAAVLRTFAHFVDQGMLPNRFPDDGQGPEYNTVDGTLWYFEAIRAYLAFRDDPDLLGTLYPVLETIVNWHLKGTRYGIKVDTADGLLHAGEPGTQLTWMDVKIEEWVVTPRMGKPVEINALWYNALCVMTDLARRLGKREQADAYLEMAERVRVNFNKRFWYVDGDYLYDVIDTPEGDDATLRPNQLIAIALHHAVLDPTRAKTVLDRCGHELVTSFGLRSLSPHEHEYTGHYEGDIPARDSAYHQGTAWSWLIGPFVSAHYKVYRNTAAAYSYLEPFRDHLLENGLGTIAEIFDGDAPHLPRGCIAQAWGVAEVLRAYREISA
jgi:predicted glycogen debranching enzyme